MARDKLTARQERFVLEYLVSGNATDAAIKAGYKPKSAYQTGFENLKKPEISARLEEHKKKLEDAKIADKKEVLQLLTSAARGETQEEVPCFDAEGSMHIVPKKIPGRDQVRALELLGKHHKLFTEGAAEGKGAQIVIDFGGIDNDEPDDKNTGE